MAKEKHKCEKGLVDWKEKPTVFEGDTIVWYGKCECGRKVYELYVQDEALYDVDTAEEL